MAFTIQYRMKQFLAPFVIEPKMDLHFLKKIHSFNADLYLIQVHVLALSSGPYNGKAWTLYTFQFAATLDAWSTDALFQFNTKHLVDLMWQFT